MTHMKGRRRAKHSAFMARIWNNTTSQSRTQGEIRLIDDELHLSDDLSGFEQDLRLCLRVAKERGCSFWSVLRSEYRGYPFGAQVVRFTPPGSRVCPIRGSGVQAMKKITRTRSGACSNAAFERTLKELDVDLKAAADHSGVVDDTPKGYDFRHVAMIYSRK